MSTQVWLARLQHRANYLRNKLVNPSTEEELLDFVNKLADLVKEG